MYYKSNKELVTSIVFTFISTFAGAIVPVLGDMSAGRSTLVAASTVAIRLGIVAVLQLIAGLRKSD